MEEPFKLVRLKHIQMQKLIRQVTLRVAVGGSLLVLLSGAGCSPVRSSGSVSVAELGLPITNSKTLLEDRSSYLTSEIVYLKIAMSKTDTRRFCRWVAKQKVSPAFHALTKPVKFPPLINGAKRGWVPKTMATSLSGAFYIDSDVYNWNCKYVINPKDSHTDILYLYAIDIMN